MGGIVKTVTVKSNFRAEQPVSPSDREEECLLVVDDDPDVLALLEALLLDAGFQPICVSDGDAAIDLFKADPQRFRLVLLDVMMPVKDGFETARELRRLLPDLALLFISGYAGRPVPADLRPGATAFLGKPFRMDALNEAISRLLPAHANRAG